jgi:hypothetical protein
MTSRPFSAAARQRKLEDRETGEVVAFLLQEVARLRDTDISTLAVKSLRGELTEDESGILQKFCDDRPDANVMRCIGELKRRCALDPKTWTAPQVHPILTAVREVPEQHEHAGFIAGERLYDMAPPGQRPRPMNRLAS